MVTMAVSTVSVIESIIVMRLCSIRSTSMPTAVRFIAFRLLGRLLCISSSSSSSSSREGRRDRDKKTAASHEDDFAVQQSLLHGDTEMSNVAKRGEELADKIGDVLLELRKVRAELSFF